MDWLQFRDPINSWTHFAWMVLAVPGTVLLCWKARRERAKQISVLVYGLSLFLCYGGSVLYHGVHGDDLIYFFSIVDFICIFLLVGGSYTPLAFNLMRGPWKWGVLATVWSLVGFGIALNLFFGELAPWMYTGLYFALGWGAILCYFELSRTLGHRRQLPLLIGGLFYTTGALINRYWYPDLSAHATMHLFVMLGSLVHFWFVLKVVVPYKLTARPGYNVAVSELQVEMVSSAELNR